MLTSEPEGPYICYRLRAEPADIVWAKRMPEDFRIRVNRRVTDQQRGKARTTIEYATILEGKAGDYLLIIDPATKRRTMFAAAAFEAAYELAPATDLSSE